MVMVGPLCEALIQERREYNSDNYSRCSGYLNVPHKYCEIGSARTLSRNITITLAR